MKKTLIVLFSIIAFTCLLASCDNSSTKNNVLTTKYTVTIEVNDKTYGSVDKTTIEVVENSNISVQGNVLSVDGKTVTASASSSTEQYSYTFDSWSYDESVTEDITVTANFIRTTNTYTVTWFNDDGTTVLETDSDILYGTIPEYNGETPIKASSADYSYTFYDWNKCISAVVSNTSYVATYTSQRLKYKFVFDTDGGSTVSDLAVQYGNTLVISDLPTSEKEGYVLEGWYIKGSTDEYTVKLGVDLTSIDFTGETEEIEAKANWVIPTYTVTFKCGETTYTTQAITKNDCATIPQEPNEEGKIFIGWKNGQNSYNFETPVTGDIELTAYYESWTIAEYKSTGSTGIVELAEGTDDAEAYGGKAYKATITGSATDTKGISITFGGSEGIDISSYAHVFLRVKIINPVNITNCTVRMGVNAEPVAGSTGYPYYDPCNQYSSDIYRHYISYDIKNLTTDTTLKTVYIARTNAAITAGGRIEIYVDHIDFVEDALTLENVTSIVNNSQNKTYTVTDGTAYSQVDIIKLNNVNNARANMLGWDIDIYTGKYAFTANFRQATNDALKNDMERAITLNFDSIDLSEYEHVYIKLKNYNTDPEYPANCTVSLKVNGNSWINVPAKDWNKTDVTTKAMYTGYFEYDILSMTDCPETLTSFTISRAGAVNGYQYGIMMYIESITFVPKAA